MSANELEHGTYSRLRPVRISTASLERRFFRVFADALEFRLEPRVRSTRTLGDSRKSRPACAARAAWRRWLLLRCEHQYLEHRLHLSQAGVRALSWRSLQPASGKIRVHRRQRTEAQRPDTRVPEFGPHRAAAHRLPDLHAIQAAHHERRLEFHRSERDSDARRLPGSR